MPFLLAALSPDPVAAGIARDCAKAFEAKDEAWFERHVAPGFVFRGLEGDPLDRDAMLARVHRWFHPLGYHVGASLALVSSQKVGAGLLLISDLTVHSQPFSFFKAPVTVTTSRERSLWTSRGKDWNVVRIAELKTSKTVDGKPVPTD